MVHLKAVAGLWLWFRQLFLMRMQAFYFLRDFCSHLARWHLPWAQLCEQQSCHCSRETADVNYKWLQVGKVGAGWIYKPCLGSFKYLLYCAVKKRGRILKKQWRPIICKPSFDVMPSYILVFTVLTAKWHKKKIKISIYKKSGMRKQKEGSRDLCGNRGIMPFKKRQCAIYKALSFLQIPVFLLGNYHLATMRKRQPMHCFDKMAIIYFNKMFSSSAQHCPGSIWLGRECWYERKTKTQYPSS